MQTKKWFRPTIRRFRRFLSPFPFDCPIFILAPPRSGSTFLYECLSRFHELYTIGHESDPIWWDLFPYDRNSNSPDDHVSAAEVTQKKAQALRGRLYLKAVGVTTARRGSHPPDLRYKLGVEPLRYLDKTIANCFHLSVLRKVFPGARYIFLVRDPRANISSMIEGWPYIERFGKPQLTEYIQQTPNTTVDHWTYPAPPGWRDQISRPLPEICAWSWKQHVEQVLDFVQSADVESMTVRYENLRDKTRQVVQSIAENMELEYNTEVRQHIQSSPQSKTTVSEPEPGKWKRKSPEAIHSALPMVRKTANRAGYEI